MKRRTNWLPTHWYIVLKEQEREMRGEGSTVSHGYSFVGVCGECGYVHETTGPCYQARRRWRSSKGPLGREPECSECGYYHSWETDCPKKRVAPPGFQVKKPEPEEEQRHSLRREAAYARRWITNRG